MMRRKPSASHCVNKPDPEAYKPLSWVFLLIILPLCLPDRRTLFLWIGAGLLPTLLATALAVHMAKLGLLYHGSTDGFMHVTVQSLLQLVLGATHPVLGWSVIVIAMRSRPGSVFRV